MKQFFIILLSAVFCLSVLSGCSSGEASTADSSPSTTNEAPTETDDPPEGDPPDDTAENIDAPDSQDAPSTPEYPMHPGDSLLPAGSVVLLSESSQKLMIIGYAQIQMVDGNPVLWDYVAAPYPEGYLASSQAQMFNHDEIAEVYAHGYQDEAQLAYMEQVNEVIGTQRAADTD